MDEMHRTNSAMVNMEWESRCSAGNCWNAQRGMMSVLHRWSLFESVAEAEEEVNQRKTDILIEWTDRH